MFFWKFLKLDSKEFCLIVCSKSWKFVSSLFRFFVTSSWQIYLNLFLFQVGFKWKSRYFSTKRQRKFRVDSKSPPANLRGRQPSHAPAINCIHLKIRSCSHTYKSGNLLNAANASQCTLKRQRMKLIFISHLFYKQLPKSDKRLKGAAGRQCFLPRSTSNTQIH
jgi:hypothetical protein